MTNLLDPNAEFSALNAEFVSIAGVDSQTESIFPRSQTGHGLEIAAPKRGHHSEAKADT